MPRASKPNVKYQESRIKTEQPATLKSKAPAVSCSHHASADVHWVKWTSTRLARADHGTGHHGDSRQSPPPSNVKSIPGPLDLTDDSISCILHPSVHTPPPPPGHHLSAETSMQIACTASQQGDDCTTNSGKRCDDSIINIYVDQKALNCRLRILRVTLNSKCRWKW